MFNKIKVNTNGELVDEMYQPTKALENMHLDASAQYEGGAIPQVPAPQIPAGTTAYAVPSKGVFYNGVDTVEVLPLSVGQVVDVDRVYKGKDAHEQLARFVSIVNQSVYGVNVHDLTMQDFYAVCYYLRLISYKRDPIMIQADFEVNGQMRKLSTPISASSIKVRDIGELTTGGELALDYIRVRDQLFIMEQGEKLTKWEAAYFAYVQGATPQAKLAAFRALRADQLEAVIKHAYDAFHGLERTVEVKSPSGEMVEMELDFDYSMFFPSFVQQAIYGDVL